MWVRQIFYLPVQLTAAKKAFRQPYKKVGRFFFVNVLIFQSTSVDCHKLSNLNLFWFDLLFTLYFCIIIALFVKNNAYVIGYLGTFVLPSVHTKMHFKVGRRWHRKRIHIRLFNLINSLLKSWLIDSKIIINWW